MDVAIRNLVVNDLAVGHGVSSASTSKAGGECERRFSAFICLVFHFSMVGVVAGMVSGHGRMALLQQATAQIRQGHYVLRKSGCVRSVEAL